MHTRVKAERKEIGRKEGTMKERRNSYRRMKEERRRRRKWRWKREVEIEERGWWMKEKVKTGIRGGRTSVRSGCRKRQSDIEGEKTRTGREEGQGPEGRKGRWWQHSLTTSLPKPLISDGATSVIDTLSQPMLLIAIIFLGHSPDHVLIIHEVYTNAGAPDTQKNRAKIRKFHKQSAYISVGEGWRQKISGFLGGNSITFFAHLS